MHRRFRKLIELTPIALPATLIVVEAVAGGSRHDVDGPRLAGVAVGTFALWRKAPFIVVVASAAATASLLRQL